MLAHVVDDIPDRLPHFRDGGIGLVHGPGYLGTELLELGSLGFSRLEVGHGVLQGLEHGIGFLQLACDLSEARLLSPKLIGEGIVFQLEASNAHVDLSRGMSHLSAEVIIAVIESLFLSFLLLNGVVHLHGHAVHTAVEVVQGALLLLQGVAVGFKLLLHHLNLLIDARLMCAPLGIPTSHLLLEARDRTHLLHGLELTHLHLLETSRMLGG
mmetsp:Transcript_1936/g.4398  ORF Transcript_1936/g.4398 Transcript_1936/m.4398 type:complete len:212 (-) Transcript_1936:235-870(-)